MSGSAPDEKKSSTGSEIQPAIVTKFGVSPLEFENPWLRSIAESTTMGEVVNHGREMFAAITRGEIKTLEMESMVRRLYGAMPPSARTSVIRACSFMEGRSPSQDMARTFVTPALSTPLPSNVPLIPPPSPPSFPPTGL